MRIKITAKVPVQARFRPKIGSLHNVVRTHESNISSTIKSHIFYIDMKGALIGVWGTECEVVEQ